MSKVEFYNKEMDVRITMPVDFLSGDENLSMEQKEIAMEALKAFVNEDFANGTIVSGIEPNEDDE